ncbi:MAG TPA: TonB-dependent receptor [Polyangiaceae bacterium]|nr:TonB-dependent receptor [Polyangiaceae bacterium]
MKLFDLYERARRARARLTRSRSGAAKLRALTSIWASASVLLAASGALAQGEEAAPAAGDSAAPGEPAPATEPSAASVPAATPAPAPPGEAGAGGAGAPLDPADLELEPSTANGAPGGGLDEVVVTVDRRRKDLQKVSGTAQAFNEKRLTSVGINSVAGLATMVPGLEIAQEEGNTEVYIRGVGNDNNAEHGDMGVALHLDGVYLPRPRGVGSLFYDIERVEVASGPQGTLRGRNAQGGSINIVTNKPKLSEFGANAEASFGTFSERRYSGMVNIPIGDQLALRFAGFSSVHDPHWHNGGPNYDLRAPQDEDTYAFRGQLKWQPVKALTIVAGADFTAERGTGYIGSNYDDALNHVNDNGTPNDTTDDTPAPITPDQVEYPRNIYQVGMQPHVNMKHWGTRLDATYDAGPFLVDGLISYRSLTYKQVNGGSLGLVYPNFPFAQRYRDGSDFFGTAYWDTASQSVVGELRAYAPDTARLRWTAGAFFLTEDQQVVLYQTNDPANGYSGAEFNMPDVFGDSQAAYADATFDLTPEFRILGGLRVTRETKGRWNGVAIQGSGFVNGGRFGTEGFRPAYMERDIFGLPQGAMVQDRVSTFLDGIASFGARDQVPQAICNDPAPGQSYIAADPQTGKLSCAAGIRDSLTNTQFTISVTPQNSKVTNIFVDYRAGVEYDLAKDSMLYATVSTAHKAAGYNDTVYRPDGTVPFTEYYDPENVTAFELGSKNTLLGRKLRLNASAFFYIYQNQVFQQIVQISPANQDSNAQAAVTSQRQNAASSNLYGLDLDVVYALPLGLEAEMHALLLDARYGKRTLVTDGRLSYDLPTYQVDIDGHWLPRASPITLNYSLSQLIFTSVGQFNWLVQGQTVARYYLTVFNGHGNLLPEANGNEPKTASDRGYAAYQQLLANPARLTDEVPTYTRFDLSAGWTHPDGRLSITGYVNNLFDIAYATTIVSTPDLNLRFFNPPRTAGVRVRVEW